MTILFVLMGVGSGIYAVVVKGVQAPDFAAQLLLIEVAAALTSAVHLHQTSSGRLHS
jgi:hypothetical protein